MPSLLKRIRLRFGISAPKMTVRTHLAWYWRWLGMMVFAAVTLAVAAWMYDAGRRFAGFDRSEIQDEMATLRSTVARLQGETDQMRAVVNASGAGLKIEQSAQAQLGAQVKQLEAENTRLKEDLAFFEGLVPGERRDEPVSIHRLKVDAGTLPGEYRYRLLVMQGGRRDREFQGTIQIIVDLQDKGRDDMIIATGNDIAESGLRKLNFRFFRRVEGTFRVSPTAKVRAVEVRVFENGHRESRVTQSVKLS